MSKKPGWYLWTVLILIAPLTIWRGYVLSVLWAWFAVTQFEVPALSIPAALGVAMLGSLFTGRWTSEVKDDDQSPTKKLVEAISSGFFGPLLILGVAAIVRMFL